MIDFNRFLCKKHRKKDRSEKFHSVPEILSFHKGGGLPKTKTRKFFMIDSYRDLLKMHRGKNRSEKFLSVPEILNFREGPPLRKIKNRKFFSINSYRVRPPDYEKFYPRVVGSSVPEILIFY